MAACFGPQPLIHGLHRLLGRLLGREAGPLVRVGIGGQACVLEVALCLIEPVPATLRHRSRALRRTRAPHLRPADPSRSRAGTNRARSNDTLLSSRSGSRGGLQVVRRAKRAHRPRDTGEGRTLGGQTTDGPPGLPGERSAERSSGPDAPSPVPASRLSRSGPGVMTVRRRARSGLARERAASV
jgi:hypothetical protein